MSMIILSLAKKSCYVSSSLYCWKIKKINEDAVRFSRRFNGSQNKGYLYTASLVGRKEIVIEFRKNYSNLMPE